ncbi:MAG: hydrogenase maturation nickel metallochaperone HypA [Candidatus Zixiibacteriota bacterium]
MHEMAVAENIATIIEERLKDLRQKAEVKSIHLKIGRLTCVEPEALRLSFTVISKDTLLGNASLLIESIPVTGKCKDCEKEFRLEEMDFACPHCGSFRIDIKTGRELLIESFEIE